MKKILAMLVVVMLVAACTVSAFAYSITTNFSDNDNNGKAVEECTLVGDWYSDKFATSWKNGTEWSAFIDALNAEDATLVITCDGNVTRIGFQSDVANIEHAVETVDGVVTVAAADLLATCGEALEGFGWCNFIISGDAGTVIKSVEISNGEETPAEEVENTETPAGETTENTETAEETTPAETGIALAVVPMMVAAAAVVVSKRR